MSTSGIYLITNTRNNLNYVGQSKNIQKRIKEHFSGSFKQNLLIDYAISKESQNFIWTILQECPENDLNYYEQYYIYYYNSMNYGYNRTFGGDEPHSGLLLYGEQHPNTYYTNQEMLEIRKAYVSHTIEELYNIYKKDQSFYTFKNQVLNSYTNLPKYYKKKKQWIYPQNWQGEKFSLLNSESSQSKISAQDIMAVRRLAMTNTPEEIIMKNGLKPFKSERHLRETINGTLFKWLPYFSQDKQCWIYPKDWTGEKEQEIDDKTWSALFYKKEKTNGRKLSNYQVLQIRYLATQNYTNNEIFNKLNLKGVCSLDAINLILKNKTYLNLPYVSKDNIWIFPNNLTDIQKEKFPIFLNALQTSLIGVDEV